MRITLFVTLSFAALSLSASASSREQFHTRQPGVPEGRQCTAFIKTARPGGNVTVPYGYVYRTLAKARLDALNRCSRTTLAQDGWGPCKTWCEEVDQ
jgi:hypothetical protein